MEQETAGLVRRMAEGDSQAFDRLMEFYYPKILRMAYLISGSHADSEDIVQETYHKSLRKIKQLKEPDKFPVWIKKIAVNTAKAHLRKVDWVLFSEADGEGGKKHRRTAGRKTGTYTGDCSGSGRDEKN